MGGILPAELKPGVGRWPTGKRFLLQQAEPGAKLALKFIKRLLGSGEKVSGGAPAVPALGKAVQGDRPTTGAEWGT